MASTPPVPSLASILTKNRTVSADLKQPITASQIHALQNGTDVSFPVTPPSASRFDFTLVPPGITPPPPPPPPPPTGFFLPDPLGYTKVLEHNFVALQQLPSQLQDWDYGGRPGGTNNSDWVDSAITVSSEGIDLTSKYVASDTTGGSGGTMECGAFGTNGTWTPPMRVRVYERDHDANLPGKNSIDLLWTGPWFYEVDGPRENGINSNGMWAQNSTRIHNDNGSNLITPIQWKYTPDFKMHCYEVELLDGNITVYYDGAVMGSEPLAPSDWTAICTKAKYVGIQDEFYSLPGAQYLGQTSVRSIYGVQVYTTFG